MDLGKYWYIEGWGHGYSMYRHNVGIDCDNQTVIDEQKSNTLLFLSEETGYRINYILEIITKLDSI